MFDLYTVLLFLHIVAAALWIGTAVYNVLAVRGGGRSAVTFIETGEPVAKVLFPVAAVVIVVTGIWMVIDSWSFGDAWVTLGIILFIVTGVTGGALLGKTASEIAEASRAGEGDAVLAPKLARFLAVGPIDVAVLLLIVGVMVFKPGS